MEPWKVTAVPEDAGVSSAGLLQYLDAVEASGMEHHAIVILRHGQLVSKMNFAPYDDQTPHILYSLSKSFCSAAAGFAVQEGLLKWDSRVLEVLPEYAPDHPSEELKQITLHHLLTMGSGLDPESDLLSFFEPDCAKRILSFPVVHASGSFFHYNSHGTYLVSSMVQKVTGQTVRDYLIPRLFEPLGIPVPEWDLSADNVCIGGWGLRLSADSIARFGQCLLQKGMWQGKQVLPAEWLARATVAQIDNGNGRYDPDDDWTQGYGYQFWRTVGNRFRGDGLFGQLCVVSEKEDMVVAVTAGIDDIAQELRLLRKYVFPAADMAPGTPQEQEKLKKRIAALGYSWPAHDETAVLPVGRYVSEKAELTVTEQEATLQYKGGEPFVLHFGCGRLVNTSIRFGFGMEKPTNFQGACGWQNQKLTMEARTLGGPFTFKGEADFGGDAVTLKLCGGQGFPKLETKLTKA